MKGLNRRSVLAWFGGAGVFALSACGIRRDISYRYRLTVEIETNDGVLSGSSVWEARQRKGSGIPDAGIRSDYRGEAVAVKVFGGTLFALLRGADLDVDYPAWVVYRHLLKHPDSAISLGNDWATNMRAIKTANLTFDLYPDEYPLLVRFRDINDPMSVDRIDPLALDLAFGSSVRLKRIHISLTNEEITTGISKELPWLSRLRQKHLNGGSYTDSNDLTSNLGGGDFSTEVS